MKSLDHAPSAGMALRWYVGTPKRFPDDRNHFTRDSGLCCRGLQMIGMESRAVLLGPPMADDDPDVIRTDSANMESADWWWQHQLDGVILYSWGAPAYLKVAQAIKQAGALLAVNIDSNGILTPYVSGMEAVRGIYRNYWFTNPWWKAAPLATVQLVRHLLPWCIDFKRAQHLDYADVIVAVSPTALDRIQKYLRFFGKPAAAERVRVGLHPIAKHMTYNGQTKLRRLIAVGRWDDPVKNIRLLMACAARALARNPAYRFDLLGSGEKEARKTLATLPPDVQTRIRWVGRVSNLELAGYYQQSRISLCTSHSEGFHTASAEALCCGCSVVGPRRSSIPNLPYYSEPNSGSLADFYSAKGIAEAISQEIIAWERGARDPQAISRLWCDRLHADRVVRRIIDWTRENRSDK